MLSCMWICIKTGSSWNKLLTSTSRKRKLNEEEIWRQTRTRLISIVRKVLKALHYNLTANWKNEWEIPTRPLSLHGMFLLFYLCPDPPRTFVGILIGFQCFDCLSVSIPGLANKIDMTSGTSIKEFTTAHCALRQILFVMFPCGWHCCQCYSSPLVQEFPVAAKLFL